VATADPVNAAAGAPNPMHREPPAPVLVVSRLEHPLSTQRARRFLAPSSDAIYTSTPLRRLESTHFADPEQLVELVGAAVSMRDEPECISGAILDSYGADALYFRSLQHARTVESARDARQFASHQLRVRDARARCKAQHRTDLRGDLLALDKALDRATRAAGLRLVEDERGFAKAEERTVVLPVSALERLERLEAALDRAPDLELAA
jgi:hypothetical protein